MSGGYKLPAYITVQRGVDVLAVPIDVSRYSGEDLRRPWVNFHVCIRLFRTSPHQSIFPGQAGAFLVRVLGGTADSTVILLDNDT